MAPESNDEPDNEPVRNKLGRGIRGKIRYSAGPEERPDPSNFDAMKEDEWTLPMVAAWFIWRSKDAVRDQWDPARSGWRKWVRFHARGRPAIGPRGPLWKLKNFGAATLADVLREARLPNSSLPLTTVKLGGATSLPRTHTPYDRLRLALQSGRLKATRGSRRAAHHFEIPKDHWLSSFDAIANDDIYMKRDDVIEVERQISRHEYEGEDWDLGQALGWIAYQSTSTFRSLWNTDLSPIPTYYGVNYPTDFLTPDPVTVLRENLLLGNLVGYVEGTQVENIEWLDVILWDFPRVKFMRSHVIKILAKHIPPSFPDKSPPTDSDLLAIYAELERKAGRLTYTISTHS